MARILNVDDVAANRLLLMAMLEGSGHEIIDAASGEQALSLAQRVRPDLVLLDVMMPGLDGFETTRRLKRQAGDEFLPIILITSLSDTKARVDGLSAGADDFLTKPVDRHELAARVKNLLALRAKELALVRSNIDLIELHRFRDEMYSLVVHDLKTPLTAVLSNLEYTLSLPDPIGADGRDALTDALMGGQRLNRLVQNLLDLALIEVGRFAVKRKPMGMAQLLDAILEPRRRFAHSHRIALDIDIPGGVCATIDTDLVTRVFENILDNALRHTPDGGRISIIGTRKEGVARMLVGNSGPAIPADAHATIFEKFGKASGPTGRMNLGLGLYFCRLAIEAHGGRIWVETRPALPTVFGIDLPGSP
jgi:two-component system, sensor histidine kinase and response regulator